MERTTATCLKNLVQARIRVGLKWDAGLTIVVPFKLAVAPGDPTLGLAFLEDLVT